MAGIFIIFPILIFWSLLRLILSDPGRVTPQLIEKIYHQNGIDKNEIGRSYSMEEVCVTLTENYFKSQNFLRKPNQ
jgi:hypothetical protein